MASSVSSIISRKSLRLRASAVKRSLNPGFTLMELLLVLVIIGLLVAPLFLFPTSVGGLLLGALLFGFFSVGAWGIVPGYLSERFPTEARGVGTGFTYHVGVGIGSYAPYLIGTLQDGGTNLSTAMLWCILSAGVLVVALLWLGPETRGTALD